jgi:hypothetical protein
MLVGSPECAPGGGVIPLRAVGRERVVGGATKRVGSPECVLGSVLTPRVRRNMASIQKNNRTYGASGRI